MAIDTGDVRRLSAIFKNSSDEDADPTTVVIKIRRHDPNNITTYTYGTDAELVKDAIGQYHTDYLIIGAGDVTYKWIGTGAVYAAEESTFAVVKSLVT